MIEFKSKWKVVSLGLVVVNKLPKTYLIEVVQIEKSPYSSGEATDNVTMYEAKDEGKDGADPVALALKTTASIEAEWIPWGNTNRITAPDVRRGEEVLIMQFADSDKYFWIEWRANSKLRRLETVTYAFSNERKENVPLTKENTYFIHLSTHEKLVHLQTSKSDGEPFQYIFQINTKDGQVTICDDIGQEIHINSKEHIVHLKNTDGCLVELNKRKINLNGVDEVNVNTKRFTVNASESITETTKRFGVTTSSYSFRGQTFDAQATFSYTGSGSISQGWTVGGNLLVKGKSDHIGQSTGPGHR